MSKKIDYDFLTQYIEDEEITDINYNGSGLWLDHLSKGRYLVDLKISDEEIEKFCYKIANFTNKQFNNSFPILESETENLRLSIIHKSVAASGYSISIRKTPPIMRLNKEKLLNENYTSLEVLNLFEEIVKSRKNIIISGLPGAGKTELLKYLTNFIKDNQRVITIEDSLEIRFSKIHKHKDGVMLKINDNINYRQAIKACLRQRPDWLLLSEVRGSEVVELLQAISTGAKLISTIHSDSAQMIPQRLLHMFEGNEISNEKIMYNIYENIDYGIHIKSKISEKGVYRFISEICKYEVKNDKYFFKVLYSKNS